jgi:hypothetical protein
MTDERPWLTTWGEVLATLPDLGQDDLVCFDDGPSSPDDPALVADGMDLAEDEDVPAEAEQRGLTTVLGKDEIQGILRNLTQQVDNPGEDLALRAIAYYTDNDAFLTVD